ncbi:MAG TPA: hypothetical protein VH020_10450 [Stellaceae bacterium]|jgi:hypothetical protein|nr:hypothetical protein [Stellaceae bacterium]
MHLTDDVLFQVNARIELHNLAGEVAKRGDTALEAILRAAVYAIDRRIAAAEEALERDTAMPRRARHSRAPRTDTAPAR